MRAIYHDHTCLAEAEPVCDLPGLRPEDYARWRASEVGAITERVERRLVLDLIGDVRGKTVLDVGCGDGDLAIEPSKRGARVSGIDVSESMIEAARARAAGEKVDIDFRVAAAQEVPFQENQFDIGRHSPPSFFPRKPSASISSMRILLQPVSIRFIRKQVRFKHQK